MEEKAKKAAVKAMELAFAKKKKLAEEKAKREAAAAAVEEEGEAEVAEGAPVPVKRTSIKKRTEYTMVAPQARGVRPVIKMADFNSSGTDYSFARGPQAQ